MIKPAAFALAAGLVLGLAGTSLANDLLATEQFSGTIVAFQPQRAYANMTLRVTGPNEYQASLSYPSGSPAWPTLWNWRRRCMPPVSNGT